MSERAKILIGLSEGKFEITGSRAFVEDKIKDLGSILKQLSEPGHVPEKTGSLEVQPQFVRKRAESAAPVRQPENHDITISESAVRKNEHTDLIKSPGNNQTCKMETSQDYACKFRISRSVKPVRGPRQAHHPGNSRHPSGQTAETTALKVGSDNQKKNRIPEMKKAQDDHVPRMSRPVKYANIPGRYEDWFEMFPPDGETCDLFLLTAFFVQSGSRVEVFDIQETQNMLASAGITIDDPDPLIEDMKSRNFIITVKKTEKEIKSRLTHGGISRIEELLKR